LIAQINLFRLELRAPRRYLSLNRLGLFILIYALCGSLWAMWVSLQIDRSQFELDTLKSQSALLDSEMTELSKKLAPQINAELQTSLQRLESQIRERESLLELLQSKLTTKDEKFSEYLLAFSRRRVPGVWLTRIAVTANGGPFSLQGRARSTDLLPVFLTQLGSDEALRGWHIADLRFSEKNVSKVVPATSDRLASQRTNSPDTLSYVDFSISSENASLSGR
jgi:Tfp pilus assembly protein PilN